MITETTSIVALVPVRAGSKGFPRKNLALMCGVPLYIRAAEQGVRVVGCTVITTNIPDIINAAPIQGVHVISRPEHLCGDESAMDEVVKHAIGVLQLRPDCTVVLLQATSPLRQDKDIVSALELFRKENFELVMSVTDSESAVLKHGTIERFRYIPLSDPGYCFMNRQSLPRIYRPNGAIYIFNVSTFLKNGGFKTNSIGASVMPASRSIDIDTESDLQEAIKRSSAEGDAKSL